MIVRWFLTLLLLVAAETAMAHPHVFVTAKTTIVFGRNGNVEGLRQVWTFDKMFSAYAIQGAGSSNVPTRADLQSLARENAEGLVEFDYFTTLKANGVVQSFEPPRDYYMEYANGELTLFFFLPLVKPAQTGKGTIWLEMYDPSYFVAFALSPADDAVTFTNAPQGCGLSLKRAKQMSVEEQKKYTEEFFNDIPPNFAQEFSSRALVVCP